MKRYFNVSIILCLFFLTACNGSSKKQFEFAGNSLSLSLDNDISTVLPREVTDYNTSVIMNQVMEGLVTTDPKSLKILPQLAKSWTVKNEGTLYEFILRDDVYFHDSKLFSSKEDRRFSVNDVVKSIEKACTKTENGLPAHAYLFLYKDKLKGANDFFLGKSKSISGLKFSGNRISMELISSDANFISKLSNTCAAISSAKLIEKNEETNMIGTGPFMFSGYENGDNKKLILIKNPEYYMSDKDGNALPYLDSVIFVINGKKLDQLEMFENKDLDMITGLPPSRITEMLEGRIKDFNSNPPVFIMYNSPLLSTNYLFFNMTDPRFADEKVRQAFNYALDREKIGRDVLQNQYYELGYYGIVPPVSSSFRGYDFGSVKEVSYNYNPEKARQLLADAGFPNGKGFGSVNLRFRIGDINSAIADEFAQQMSQVLNINVNIDGSTFESLDNDAQAAKGDIFRSTWIGDYLNPETFLYNFYGTLVPSSKDQLSSINQSRYQNAAFDQFFEKARNASKLSDAMIYYTKAEQELMKNPPIIPLWYTGDIQIIYSDVRNLYFNPFNAFYFKEVYKKPLTSEEYQKQIKEIN